MTYEDAKAKLLWDSECDRFCDRCSYEKCQVGIARLMAVEALEKQIPKMPKKLTYEPLIKGGWTYECPCCGLAVGENVFTDYEYIEPIEPFCGQCGQAIDWSEVE